MSLADRITELGRDAELRLAAVLDYFDDTVLAWRVVATGATEDPTAFVHSDHRAADVPLTDLVDRSRGHVATYLAEATFTQSLGVFEDYFFGLLRLWLAAHPRGLGNKQVELHALLDAGTFDAAVGLFVDEELDSVLYNRPADWFAYLDGKARLGCPSADEIARFAEAKATRDVLNHNRGVVTDRYVEKAGGLARYKAGELVDVPDNYHRDTVGLLRKMAADVTTAAAAKVV